MAKESFHTRLSPDLIKQLKQEAVKENITLAELCERKLSQPLKKEVTANKPEQHNSANATNTNSVDMTIFNAMAMDVFEIKNIIKAHYYHSYGDNPKCQFYWISENDIDDIANGNKKISEMASKGISNEELKELQQKYK